MNYILVTGADSGIGRKVVERLLDNNKNVIALCLKSLYNDDRILEYVCDLNDLDCISDLFGICEAKEICIEGIIHCAGVCIKQEVNEISKENMFCSFNVNVFSFIEICKHYFAYRNRSYKSSIIAISSITADRAYKTQLLYAASKAALNSVVKSLAQEGLNKGILVNAVEFGAVNTPMFKSLEPNMETILKHYPLGVLEDDAAADMIISLLDDRYNKMTGSILVYDSGFSVIH